MTLHVADGIHGLGQGLHELGTTTVSPYEIALIDAAIQRMCRIWCESAVGGAGAPTRHVVQWHTEIDAYLARRVSRHGGASHDLHGTPC